MRGDLINGSFEAIGASALALNVRRLWRDKTIQGVHWASTAFFAAWGFWNLAYYPSLGQWASFAGGCALVAANLVWLISLAIIVNRRGA